MKHARHNWIPEVPTRLELINPIHLYSTLETNKDALAHNNRRHLLTLAIKQLPAIAESRGYDAPLLPKSILLACEFVEALPTNRALPRVFVEEDGGVVMIWNDSKSLALTFEGAKLHASVNPGARSTHLEPMIYNGGHIHPKLLVHIPKRGN